MCVCLCEWERAIRPFVLHADILRQKGTGSLIVLSESGHAFQINCTKRRSVIFLCQQYNSSAQHQNTHLANTHRPAGGRLCANNDLIWIYAAQFIYYSLVVVPRTMWETVSKYLRIQNKPNLYFWFIIEIRWFLFSLFKVFLLLLSILSFLLIFLPWPIV